jgi:hypothetical protein
MHEKQFVLMFEKYWALYVKMHAPDRNLMWSWTLSAAVDALDRVSVGDDVGCQVASLGGNVFQFSFLNIEHLMSYNAQYFLNISTSMGD